jgi:polysaccharide deacetylase 2 family uncharacterized protein YibQ
MPGPSRSFALKALAWLWGAVAFVLIGGALILQSLGPGAAPQSSTAADPAPAPAAAAPQPPQVITPSPPPAPPPPRFTPGRDTPGPINTPDPALEELSPTDKTETLPRVATDGRAPMQVYARGFDQSSLRPRIGLVVAGIGLNQSESSDAIHNLAGGVTLAFSPYATRTSHLLDDARLTGHEFLISVPMEPALYPQNDAGDHALMTSATADNNLSLLYWSLSRIQGYAGATGALGGLRGERFAASPALMPVLRVLADRGLYYIDPRPGSAPLPLVIDEPAVRSEIDAKLAQLEQIAHDRGRALGLIGAPRPIVMERVQAWTNNLLDRGYTLAPVSALLNAPPESPR